MIHKLIREGFDNTLDSRTTPDGINVFNKGFRKGGITQRWDSSQPEYLEFTMSKLLLTTSDAIERVARGSGHLATRFAVAGSKDRNALTMQRMTGWRITEKDLKRINSTTVAIRDIIPKSEPMKLGNLQGNVFCITLRPKEEEEDNINHNIENDIQNILDKGQSIYTNYFGEQRFGNDGEINSVVASMMLRSEYRKAVLLLLLLPQGNKEIKCNLINLNIVLEWLNSSDDNQLNELWNDYSNQILKLIPDDNRITKRMEIISSLLNYDYSGLTTALQGNKRTPLVQRKLLDSCQKQLKKHDKIDYKQTFNALPKNLRLLFVNAYQSQLWNDGAEYLTNRGGVEEGDLVLVNNQNEPLSAWDVGRLNIIMTGSKLKMNVGEKAYVRKVSADAYDRKCFPVSSLVLPLAGDAVEADERMWQRIQDDGLNILIDGSNTDSLLRLPGAYRHVYVNARNVRVRNGNDWKSSSDSDNSDSKGFNEFVEKHWNNGNMKNFLSHTALIKENCRELRSLPIRSVFKSVGLKRSVQK